MTFDGPDAVKRAVMAGLGIAMMSKLTVEDELDRQRLAALRIRTLLPRRAFIVIEHPQKHHGAAGRAMLDLLGEAFPPARVREPAATEGRRRSPRRTRVAPPAG